MYEFKYKGKKECTDSLMVNYISVFQTSKSHLILLFILPLFVA